MNDELIAYSPDEVAKLLKKTRRTIYAWIAKGYLPANKIGNSWFILKDDISQMLNDGSLIHEVK